VHGLLSSQIVCPAIQPSVESQIGGVHSSGVAVPAQDIGVNEHVPLFELQPSLVHALLSLQLTGVDEQAPLDILHFWGLHKLLSSQRIS
jgi:hypothetical protein